MKFLRTKLVSSFKSRHSQSKTQARHKSSERIVLIGKTNIGFFSLSKPCSFFLYYTGFQNAHQDWALEGRVSSQYWSQHLMSNNTQAYFGEWSRLPLNMILHTVLHSCWIENLPQFGNEKGLIAPFPTFPDDNTTSNFSTTRLRIISYFCFSQRKVQSRWKQNQKQKNICDFVVLTSVLISRNSCWMKKFLSIVRCWLLKLF